jgi:hypothetical protein
MNYLDFPELHAHYADLKKFKRERLAENDMVIYRKIHGSLKKMKEFVMAQWDIETDDFAEKI